MTTNTAPAGGGFGVAGSWPQPVQTFVLGQDDIIGLALGQSALTYPAAVTGVDAFPIGLPLRAVYDLNEYNLTSGILFFRQD